MTYKDGVIGYKQRRILRELLAMGGSCDAANSLYRKGDGPIQGHHGRVKRLESRGLVTQTPTGVGRAKRVQLTSEGAKLALEAKREFEEASREGINA